MHPAYSGKIQPLLVETFGNKPIKDLTTDKRYVGQIEAGQRANMGFDISSVINSVLNSEGDTLERDEVLATLDTERLITKQRAIAASITRAYAAKELAKSSLLRAQIFTKYFRASFKRNFAKQRLC